MSVKHYHLYLHNYYFIYNMLLNLKLSKKINNFILRSRSQEPFNLKCFDTANSIQILCQKPLNIAKRINKKGRSYYLPNLLLVLVLTSPPKSLYII